MFCPSCGHKLTKNLAYCENCGVPVNNSHQTTSSDCNNKTVSTCEHNSQAPSTSINPEPTAGVSGPVKQSGHTKRNISIALAIFVAIAIAVAAFGGTQKPPRLKSASSQQIGPLADEWCVGTWYAAGMTTTGADDLVWGDFSGTTLSVDADGSGILVFSDDDDGPYKCTVTKAGKQNGITTYTCTFDFDEGMTPATLFAYDDPIENDSLVSLIFNEDPNFILTFCKDKSTVQNHPWSQLDSGSAKGHSGTDNFSNSSSATMGERNALGKAKSYLDTVGGFSESGLRDQLEFEGFEADEISYALEHCGADWNEQCAEKAQRYLDSMSMSRSELYSQLEFEGFTSSQISYGLSKVGY